jgi:hypothetical protein
MLPVYDSAYVYNQLFSCNEVNTHYSDCLYLHLRQCREHDMVFYKLPYRNRDIKKSKKARDLNGSPAFFLFKILHYFFISMSLINRLISANQIFKIRLTTLSINALAAPYHTDHKFHPYIYLVLRIQ